MLSWWCFITNTLSHSKCFLVVTAIAGLILSEIFLFWWFLFVSSEVGGLLCWMLRTAVVISSLRVWKRLIICVKHASSWILCGKLRLILADCKEEKGRRTDSSPAVLEKCHRMDKVEESRRQMKQSFYFSSNEEHSLWKRIILEMGSGGWNQCQSR